MRFYIDYKQLIPEQKQYLLDNYPMSPPVKSILEDTDRKDPCYLFFKRFYNEIWWDDVVRGKIISFDTFVIKINEYKLMEML